MSETLTRADLSEAIYSEVGISKVESSQIVDQIFEEMILELCLLYTSPSPRD